MCACLGPKLLEHNPRRHRPDPEFMETSGRNALVQFLEFAIKDTLLTFLCFSSYNVYF